MTQRDYKVLGVKLRTSECKAALQPSEHLPGLTIAIVNPLLHGRFVRGTPRSSLHYLWEVQWSDHCFSPELCWSLLCSISLLWRGSSQEALSLLKDNMLGADPGTKWEEWALTPLLPPFSDIPKKEPVPPYPRWSEFWERPWGSLSETYLKAGETKFRDFICFAKAGGARIILQSSMSLVFVCFFCLFAILFCNNSGLKDQSCWVSRQPPVMLGLNPSWSCTSKFACYLLYYLFGPSLMLFPFISSALIEPNCVPGKHWEDPWDSFCVVNRSTKSTHMLPSVWWRYRECWWVRG